MIFRLLAILMILTGFALNMRCDPLHEWVARDDAHAEQAHDASSPDAGKKPASCRSHCQFMHAMAWLPTETLEQPLFERKTAAEFFYEGLRASPYPAQLLRPPAAPVLS